jgi:hypothetical protein
VAHLDRRLGSVGEYLHRFAIHEAADTQEQMFDSHIPLTWATPPHWAMATHHAQTVITTNHFAMKTTNLGEEWIRSVVANGRTFRS